ncbi:DUF3368 domain-containing protein [Nostoc sp. CHAB 5836]|uniref:DUF3368 domain-containing protein n=1 Tax=Nostoc sp. CHAB 5836 TaxID=2780404 RepID=UPI001E3006A6|nr:DUF3368 domain-containing protein [Nostoc sp. CHAB 5836]MCC5617953.1 DUF3368 domain-containing protein [Nostoc sp. CHAB 5836]
MPVVSNTSPILNLAIIDRLILLHQQFDEILIPIAVLDELKISEDRPGSQAIREAISAGWIQSREVTNEPLAQLLKQTLDKGESEAIALAVELKADWTLLDEREGRKVAKSLGLKVTGILGLLLRAKQSGELESLQPAINELISKAGFRIAPELLVQILTQ